MPWVERRDLHSEFCVPLSPGAETAPTGTTAELDPREHIIIGGGFGGLTLALALRHVPVRVTLIDRRNYHLFQPLFYQVVTAGSHPRTSRPRSAGS